MTAAPFKNRDVFHAIADPVRRKIIDLVSRETMSMNDIASRFDISRPAVSRHMRVLRECGVIHMEVRGRQRICKIQWASLQKLDTWVSSYRRHWEARYDELDTYLHNLQSKQSNHDKSR